MLRLDRARPPRRAQAPCLRVRAGGTPRESIHVRTVHSHSAARPQLRHPLAGRPVAPGGRRPGVHGGARPTPRRSAGHDPGAGAPGHHAAGRPVGRGAVQHRAVPGVVAVSGARHQCGRAPQPPDPQRDGDPARHRLRASCGTRTATSSPTITSSSTPRRPRSCSTTTPSGRPRSSAPRPTRTWRCCRSTRPRRSSSPSRWGPRATCRWARRCSPSATRSAWIRP